MVGEIRTSDVFEASYFRSCGLDLVAMEVKEDLPSGSECSFVLTGEEALIDELSAAYMTGRAVVNLTRFKRSYFESLQNLRTAKKQLKIGGGK